MLKFCRIVLPLPCKKEFRILLAGDTHLIHTDPLDNERKQELSIRRRLDFGEKEAILTNWEETIAYANTHCDLLLHAGDLIDFVSYGNLALMKENQKKIRIPFLMAPGNHEFSQYVGEAKEDDAYKAESFELVEKAADQVLDFAKLEYNGVLFIAIDNSYYLFKERHLTLLKQECSKGLPVILLLHTPLYGEEMYDLSQKTRNHPCTYLCGVPEEKMHSYPPDRREQQKPDAVTLEMLDFIRTTPAIKGIFAGHLHFQALAPFTGESLQIITGGNFRGEVTEIFVQNPA